MLMVADVNEEKRRYNCKPLESLKGLEKLYAERSCVPAITHVDYSARVQTVDAERNPAFYNLLKSFEGKTGSPVLINTSFNVRGEPIVCTPQDAYRCFLGTNMDVLVVGKFVMRREAQPGGGELDNSEYLKQFALD
jgi:carbamoyltransferase